MVIDNVLSTIAGTLVDAGDYVRWTNMGIVEKLYFNRIVSKFFTFEFYDRNTLVAHLPYILMNVENCLTAFKDWDLIKQENPRQFVVYNKSTYEGYDFRLVEGVSAIAQPAMLDGTMICTMSPSEIVAGAIYDVTHHKPDQALKFIYYLTLAQYSTIDEIAQFYTSKYNNQFRDDFDMNYEYCRSYADALGIDHYDWVREFEQFQDFYQFFKSEVLQ